MIPSHTPIPLLEQMGVTSRRRARTGGAGCTCSRWFKAISLTVNGKKFISGQRITLIDTDKARKELEGAGFTPEQAEAQLNVARMLDQEYRETLATKADLEKLQAATKALVYRTAVVTIGIILAGMWGLLELYL